MSNLGGENNKYDLFLIEYKIYRQYILWCKFIYRVITVI